MPTSLSEGIRRAFAERYGCPPSVVVRAPGRVNLIGEHTDYSNLPVLPMAIGQSLYIAAAATGDGVIEAASQQFELAARFERGLPPARLEAPWQRYLAGAAQMTEVAKGRGARLIIGGDLPAAGGLSSSSALTVGVMAALDVAWGEELEGDAVVRRAIVAERNVGVESGGMDQEVIVFGQAGAALRIDFDPPSRRVVPIPPGLAFVVAASGEDAPKGGAARDAYNERVVGARLAAAMLADQVGIDIRMPPVLGDVAGVDVVDILVDDLPEKVSAQEVAHGVEVELEHLVRLTAGRFDHMAKVPVRRVARHILGEARRVDEAEAALLAGDLEAFGKLLDASHNSLRQDFRCSTPALDRVCAAMRKAGAYGARLTGAGFGGYALAAVGPERATAVIEAAIAATGGPAFEVQAASGLELL
jgi:galactokinase